MVKPTGLKRAFIPNLLNLSFNTLAQQPARGTASPRAHVGSRNLRGRAAHEREANSRSVVESCHSTWIFDFQNHRFRRVVKGPAIITKALSTTWRSFDHVMFDSESGAFLIFLDALGTRVLRSRRHNANCDRCGEITSEISLDDLRVAFANSPNDEPSTFE